MCGTVAVLAAGGLCGCATPEAARQMLLAANRDYLQGQYAAAVQATGTFLRSFGTSPATGEAYYLRGLSRLRLDQRDAARADFGLAVREAQRDDLRGYGEAMLGHLAYEDGDYATAAAHYARAEPILLTTPPADEVLFRYGVSLQRVGRWAEAKPRFAKLLQYFPNSPQAAGARRRVLWRFDYFVIQCGAFSRVDNANNAAAAFAKKGLTAKPEYFEVDGKALWRLLTGQYPTYAAALADLPRVQALEPGAVILP